MHSALRRVQLPFGGRHHIPPTLRCTASVYCLNAERFHFYTHNCSCCSLEDQAMQGTCKERVRLPLLSSMQVRSVTRCSRLKHTLQQDPTLHLDPGQVCLPAQSLLTGVPNYKSHETMQNHHCHASGSTNQPWKLEKSCISRGKGSHRVTSTTLLTHFSTKLYHHVLQPPAGSWLTDDQVASLLFFTGTQKFMPITQKGTVWRGIKYMSLQQWKTVWRGITLNLH